MPSGPNGLDSRRLNQVRPRDMTEDHSPDAAYARLRHSRLAEILGEKGAKTFEANLYNFQREWAKR